MKPSIPKITVTNYITDSLPEDGPDETEVEDEIEIEGEIEIEEETEIVLQVQTSQDSGQDSGAAQSESSESDKPLDGASDQIIIENITGTKYEEMSSSHVSDYETLTETEDSSPELPVIPSRSLPNLGRDEITETLVSPTEEALEDLLSIIPQLHKGTGELRFVIGRLFVHSFIILFV